MRSLLTIIASVLFLSAGAQFFDATEYDWGKPEYENIEGQDSTDKYVILSKSLFNYYYDKEGLKEQYLYHRKYQIYSDDAIEANNRIYVSSSQEKDGMIVFKARVINPGGKVKELTEDDWLTGVDEDSEREYTYVALEGVERGSQIEYFYIKLIGPNYSGVSVTPQGDEPVKRFELDVISPWNLEFAAKVYNMDTAMIVDTAIEDENRLYLRLDSIPELADEPTSFWEKNLIRVVFKLENNNYNGKRNVISYANTSQNVVNAVNMEWSKKELKAISKIEKEIGIPEDASSVDVIRAVENYLKENYQYLDINHPELSTVTSIVDNKVFNELGALRLYGQIFKNHDIEYQMVYTCDRSEKIFDEDFETAFPLDDVILYFPDEDDFLDFSSPLYRFGVISPYNCGQPSLFISAMELDGNVVGAGTVEEIPSKDAKFTLDTLVINVNFAEDLFDNSLDVRRVMTGYHAQYYQPLVEMVIEEEDKTDITESILKYINSEAEVKDMKVENATADMLGVKPLIVSGRLEEANFVDKAGTNYLFKVGELIGPQQEMYLEDGVRHMPIESEFARTYMRTINFTIPEGFEVENLDDLNMDFTMDYEGETSALFQSSYTVDGRNVQVNIVEYYEEVTYPKEMFDEYKSVINAAADFNKITLLLKKS